MYVNPYPFPSLFTINYRLMECRDKVNFPDLKSRRIRILQLLFLYDFRCNRQNLFDFGQDPFTFSARINGYGSAVLIRTDEAADSLPDS